MQIQRHLLKDGEAMTPFGEHTYQHRPNFNWYIGDEKIGITGNPSTETQMFLGGILVQDGVLLITPHPKYPSIKREGISYATMGGTGAGVEETNQLISLIQDAEVTHMYFTSVGVGAPP